MQKPPMYDTNGNIAGAQRFVTTSYDFAYDIFVDATGMYIAGATYGVFPGTPSGQTNAGEYDAFVCTVSWRPTAL